MQEQKLRWGIVIEKIWEKSWSFGICFSHQVNETYLYINLFKWTISIGKLYMKMKEENRVL